MLDFSEDYILENDKISLIPLGREHVIDLLKISQNKSIWTYFFEDGLSETSLMSYIENAIQNRKEKQEYPFVIFDKSKQKCVGSTRLYEYSEELKTIKIGHTWLGKDFQGTTVNKNVKYLLFQFIFDQLAIDRIGFGVYEDNIISIKALQSVGCKKEGVLRSMFPSFDGIGRADAILMSILKQEWDSNIREQLKSKL